ncbi:hypothetical protein PAHAL_7G023300 [Panicum hallii]|uniref:Uncharacterized protein n=1 Tax=Panicum hallii TaxID=206008 RepID=A0A2T8IAQ9_9POAL|nr:hypothetical protein PAHAL_7G023300 [Panicum hallii]
MLELCCLLRQQLLGAVRAPIRRPRRRGRRGGEHVDAARHANNLAAHLGPPVMLDSCFAEGCILVRCPRHYPSHGWTARVRIKHGGSPAPLEVTTYCSIHEWMSYFHDEGGPSVAAPHAYGITSPRRPPSPTAAGLEPQGTMASRRGVPPYYNNVTSSGAAALVVYSKPELAHPPPPPTPTPTRPNMTAAANSRPGLHRVIPTGLIPTGATLCSTEPRPSRSHEGEA